MDKKLTLFVFCLLFFIFCLPVSAHPGRTDANGGHWDSSTGTYHYHHGYPAHSHEGGTCPYEFDDRTAENSGSVSSRSTIQITSEIKTNDNGGSSMIKSLLIYGAVLIAVFALRFVMVGIVNHLEEKLQQWKNPSPPVLYPFILSILMFISGVLIVAQFAVPVLWIISKWDKPFAAALCLAILIAAFVGTYMSFAGLRDMRKYGITKTPFVLSFIAFFLYIDWFINLACDAFVSGFGFPDFVRMVMNLSIFAAYMIYLIVLLVRSLKIISV